MGRYKDKNKHLPPRMRLINGRYYWVGHKIDPHTGKSERPTEPLGGEYIVALMKYREIEGDPQSSNTVASMIDHFIATHPSKSERTLKEYGKLATRLKKALAGFSAAEVKPKHVRLILSTTKSKSQANHLVVLLSSAFNKARGDGIYDGPNPCDGITRHHIKGRTRKPTAEELVKLAEGHGVMPIACELYSLIGVRVADVRLMELAQLEEHGIRVQPAKTKNNTAVELFFEWTPALRACVARAKLLRRRQGCKYLFCNRDGEPYTHNGWTSLWRAHRKRTKVGQDLQLKDLRRGALAAKKAAEGTDAAKEFAGHASVTTTEGYLKGVTTVRVKPTR